MTFTLLMMYFYPKYNKNREKNTGRGSGKMGLLSEM